MVYDSKTYELLHDLHPSAYDAYCRILESAADEILYKHKHPIKWFFGKVFNIEIDYAAETNLPEYRYECEAFEDLV